MNRWPRWIAGRDPRRTAVRILLLAAICIPLFRFTLRPTIIHGISMEPTYRDGSLHMANLMQFRRRDPRRGEVVVIRMAGGASLYLKRVVGLPGERVRFQHGHLYINGAAQPEPYLADKGAWLMPELTLGLDEYFIAGDNRMIPMQQHSLGVVRREQIAGGLLF